MAASRINRSRWTFSGALTASRNLGTHRLRALTEPIGFTQGARTAIRLAVYRDVGPSVQGPDCSAHSCAAMLALSKRDRSISPP